ncbi:MAG: phosphoribosyltransferase family protein [Myxococcales bacterium]|nr:phosphoribosyltransferase family protein [Myxococcota bacterium]MDW8281674.1 phosphoribosyltransferase family protein [Myxococcales bacterium]
MKQVNLTWDWFDSSVQEMLQRSRERLVQDCTSPERTLDGIIVLGRGGMVLGVRLSHLLQVPIVGAVLMSRYNTLQDRTPGPPVDGVVVSPSLLRQRGMVLLVDNIISEGVTLRLALRALEEAGVHPKRVQVLALLARGGHAPEGIIGQRVEDQDTWFVFPWEARS